ncbi:hypothetical protein J437_LFUL006590, partial [Ladona fulva]
MKGAPPTVAYLKKIFPILAHLGATGILLEWEDVFPFASISPLAAGNAYSRSDVAAILASARSNDLEVIPLVQTFGHLEFALKHAEWSSLREDERVPTALCPSLNASRVFVERMLDEVISAHSVDGRAPKFVHIGCDEVFQLGECPRCRSSPRERLFLSHVTHVAASVRNRFGSTPIIWDDMLRHVSPEAMRESGLGNLVEPMVWVYAEDVYRFVPPGVWDKYAAIFDRVWAASAFKGAFGETLYVPNAKRHLDNNLRWLDVMSRESTKFKGGFRGLVLTGWQRYDHFAVLCELLPAAVPSLAVSLLTVTKGRFDAFLRKDLHAALSCPETGVRDPTGSGWADLSGDPFLWDRFSRCLFPGALLYRLTARLQATEREFSALVEAVHHRRGWMTPYNVRHNFSSPLRVEEVAGVEQVARLQQSVENLIRSARDSLVDILEPFAISEWIEQRLYPMVTELDSIARDAAVLKSKRTWPARPLPPLEELRRFGITVPPLPSAQPQMETKKEHRQGNGIDRLIKQLNKWSIRASTPFRCDAASTCLSSYFRVRLNLEMRFAVSFAYRLGFSAWRRKSTILAAIGTLLLLLVCLQYSSFGGRTEGKIFAVEDSSSTEELPSGGSKQRRVQFVLNQVDVAPSEKPSRLPDPPAREDLERRHAFLQQYADDK